jgi:hypothetical protein
MTGAMSVSLEKSRAGCDACPFVTRRMVVLLLALALVIAVYLDLVLGGGSGPRLLFLARFPGYGLVTNEYAYFNPTDPRAVRSSEWEATSGSLFARGGDGWTGRPDGIGANARSSAATDSAVFRLRTRRSDFKDVSVSFRLRMGPLVTTSRTPAEAYDGVHVWLRYQSPQWLYFASVSRRDGRIVIGKKLPTASGGRYYDLVRVPGHRFPVGQWKSVLVTIRSSGRDVLIDVRVGGKLVAKASDDGTEGPVILHAGRVGIRGDNANFEFQRFAVRTR